MTLEILLSCMHQSDEALVHTSKLTGNCVIINQCDQDEYRECRTQNGIARMFFTTQRGLTKSRNMAIRTAKADICMLADDDEEFVPDYEARILKAYEALPDADVIAFKMIHRPRSFGDKVMRVRFPNTMKISSVQISFKRESLLNNGVCFDELLGAGSGNGAEEELKFLTDCERAGLKIYYVPVEIAAVGAESSTWFGGFDEKFFENRGATTRYILGLPLASLYAIYYVLTKKALYQKNISPAGALKATFRGIMKNRITKLKKQKGE